MDECGYWILVWDSWSAGLVLFSPRLHTEGEDIYGNPCNWWNCSEVVTEDEIAEKHKLATKYHHWKVIFS